jgi:hypothetical protein
MENINLPVPIDIETRIRAKMDLFSSGDKMHKWAGNSNISTLFYLYLFNKYKSRCILSSIYNDFSPLGLIIAFDQITTNDYYLRKQIKHISTQFVECVKSGTSVIIIPVVVCSKTFSHANVLIYRKHSNTIEHFEPHGELNSDSLNSSMVQPIIQWFVDMINSKLELDGLPPIDILHANDTCPKYGFQTIESDHALLATEGDGYCQTWSLFMAELALRNPEIPGKILTENLLSYVKTKGGGQYLRKVIRGYVVLIYDKIDHYYSAVVGVPLTPEVLTTKDFKLKDWVNTLVRVEMDLLNNNPKISTSKYIHRLNKFKTSVQTWVKQNDELGTWKNMIDGSVSMRNPSPSRTKKIHIASRIGKLMRSNSSSKSHSSHSSHSSHNSSHSSHNSSHNSSHSSSHKLSSPNSSLPYTPDTSTSNSYFKTGQPDLGHKRKRSLTLSSKDKKQGKTRRAEIDADIL